MGDFREGVKIQIVMNFAIEISMQKFTSNTVCRQVIFDWTRNTSPDLLRVL